MRSHPAHSAGGRKTKIQNQAKTILFSTHTVRAVRTRSSHNGGLRKSAKEHAHGADNISAEKEPDKTVTMSRTDTVSRTEGGGESRTTLIMIAARMHSVQAKFRQIRTKRN